MKYADYYKVVNQNFTELKKYPFIMLYIPSTVIQTPIRIRVVAANTDVPKVAVGMDLSAGKIVN